MRSSGDSHMLQVSVFIGAVPVENRVVVSARGECCDILPPSSFSAESFPRTTLLKCSVVKDHFVKFAVPCGAPRFQT